MKIIFILIIYTIMTNDLMCLPFALNVHGEANVKGVVK
jgi:hypothetical protein